MGTHCHSHKLDGHIDVRHLSCQAPECNIIASVGPIGEGPVRCATHRQNGDVRSCRRQCSDIEGTTEAGFGLEMGKALSCWRHASPGYKYVIEHRCETEMCSVYAMIDRTVGRYTQNGVRMCGSCFKQMYPDLNKLKVKQEHFILSEIQSRMPWLEEYFMVHDCPLPCATSMERPDMLWMVGSTLLHVEIDETPTHEDDRDRLRRILAGTDAVDHIVVRIHTHEFCDDGLERSSCFKNIRLRNGEKAIVANSEFNRRMGIVVKTIDDLLLKNTSEVTILFAVT